MVKPEQTLRDKFEERNFSRRSFVKACVALTAAMGLPASMVPEITKAAETKELPVVIWLHGHECTGCSESFLRSRGPLTSDVVLNMISLEAHETLSASCGNNLSDHMLEVKKKYAGKYILAVEGAVATADNGSYCMVGGRTFADEVKEFAKDALAVIEFGSCSSWGGIQAAKPNPTKSMSVSKALNISAPVVKVPGCPPIPEVMTSVIMHFAFFDSLPDLDRFGRPKQFYGNRIHDTCYRRAFFDSGLYAEEFDDMGAKAGWCLYKIGCRGPTTYNSCGNLRWWQGLSFPIQSGHGCIGCSEDGFWDNDYFYQRLPNLPVPNTIADADKLFAAAGVAITGAVVIHGAITAASKKRERLAEAQEDKVK